VGSGKALKFRQMEHMYLDMSRAFVKEQDMEQADELGELPLSAHPNYVTPRGLMLLRERQAQAQRRLEGLGKDAFGVELERARIERELRWLAARIGSALPIAAATQPRDRVAFGASVVLANADSGTVQTYRIVGEDEADPEQGLVSWVSPLAKALHGAKVGDLVSWKRPAGDQELEVLKLSYATE